ncbi:DUF4214 domain-containing protein [Alsobacter sp. SYSU BS001988]
MGPGENPFELRWRERLYMNVLDRPGDTGGISFWTSLLDQGTTRGDVLLGFSESHENILKTASATDNGIILL